MRLIYLAPVVLGFMLVGCGPDEPTKVDPPPATTNQAPAGGTGTGTDPNIQSAPPAQPGETNR